MHAHDTDQTDQDPKDFWEAHYGERERIWSGRVNAQLAAVVGDLAPAPRSTSGVGRVATRSGWPSVAGT